ncbi:MAG TPA: FUSC family protein [Solirubrobacteraceae bacterium]|nr:FUSC family protein [Solirubrobacteraceae bacterium]
MIDPVPNRRICMAIAHRHRIHISIPEGPVLDRAALKSAARAAIVMPAVFAFADNVIAQPQTTIFSAFGSFAVLVLADFSGPWRSRLAAYLALAATGAVLISLGTLCSQSTVVATVVMGLVGFAVLFAGVINGYTASGGFAALLTFIISVNIPAPLSAVPDRLAGWGLACAVAITAVMLVWPARPRAELRHAAARASAGLADVLEAELAREPSRFRERAAAARDAVASLRDRFLATPNRPTGASGSTEALAFLVDELDWLRSLVVPPTGEMPDGPGLCRAENQEAIAAAIAVLRAGAARLEGGDDRPDLARLERARDAVVEALVAEVRDLPADADDSALLDELEPAVRTRELTYAVWEIGANALLATGSAPPEVDQARRIGTSRPRAVGRLAAEHARLRSVWFRNSVRGAAALAASVFVAQQTSVQRSFWVVLGTLSVLRSNALGTASTIVSAIAGTAVGLVVGVGFVLAIGTHQSALWVALPFAVLLAAYAPRAISFAAGQAGFTVVLVILFNLIQPVGWKVGLVRVEDVAIGFAISLVVGLLFWPRGAGSLLRAALADAFTRSGEYVDAAVRGLADGGGSTPAAVARARRAARGAAARLDDAFRQVLAERRIEQLDIQSAGALMAGATRVRLTAYSLLTMAGAGSAAPNDQACAGALDREAEAVRSWYTAFGDALARSAPAPPPHRRDDDGARRVVRCLREAVADGDEERIRASLALVLASQQLAQLQGLEPALARHAAELAQNPVD